MKDGEIMKFENQEQGGVSISLDKNKLMYAGVGRNVASNVGELFKVFAVIKQLKKMGLTTKKEVKEKAEDLFNELGAGTFDYEDIFTMNVVNKILGQGNTVDEMTFELNDTPLTIKSGSTVESVMQQFDKANEETDEDKDRLKEEEKERLELKKQQESVDKMFSDLETMDFKNMEEVIDWLHDYNKKVSWVGIEDHKDEVVRKFEENGYSSEKNDEIEFMIASSLEDKKRKGEAIVGWFLLNLGLLREGETKSAVADWKKMK